MKKNKMHWNICIRLNGWSQTQAATGDWDKAIQTMQKVIAISEEQEFAFLPLARQQLKQLQMKAIPEEKFMLITDRITRGLKESYLDSTKADKQ